MLASPSGSPHAEMELKICVALSPEPLDARPLVTDRLIEISTKDLESPLIAGLSVE